MKIDVKEQDENSMTFIVKNCYDESAKISY